MANVIGERILKIRKAKGITQHELADKLDCKRQKIADWEREKASPSINDLIPLSKVFNVSADYLLGITDIEKPPENITEYRTAALKEIIETYGQVSQEDIAIEEMSEFIKAIIKHRRYHTEQTATDIREEIADVKIMVTQLEMIYGDVSDIVDFKIIRQKYRLGECENEQPEN